MTGIGTKLFCTNGPTFVVLPGMVDDLWCGQDQNGVNGDFGVKIDLKVQGRLLHKTLGMVTKLFCTSDPNLVILTWTGHELSRGQASDWHTQTYIQRYTNTHTHTQATTIPLSPNWSLIKISTKSIYDVVRKGVSLQNVTQNYGSPNDAICSGVNGIECSCVEEM